MAVECDVLVVGAGPAGSSAARSAVLSSAKTLLIDKKEEIGVPVQCAEAIGEYLFPYLPFEIPKEQLIWRTEGVFFWADDISIERSGNQWNAYSIDRRKFDRWLSELAVSNGAELWTNAELIDLELDEENNVKKAIVNRNGKIFEISPKVVVAADGSESTVLKLLGLYNPKRGDLAEVYSWEMKNLDIYKPHFEQIFSGSFSPCGYAYIFPKSKDTANVGVGSILPKRKKEDYFEEFLEVEHVKKQIKNAEFVVEKSKKAIWNDLTDKWIYENILLTGDTANQNLKPFIEGILPSIICGDISGKFAFDISKGENINNIQYLIKVIEKLHSTFNISRNIQEIMPKLYAKGKSDKEKHLLLMYLASGLLELEQLDEIDYKTFKKLIKIEYVD